MNTNENAATTQLVQPPMLKKTYTVYEIAELLQISKSKAYELAKSGEFRIVQIGRSVRISKESFDRWLNNMT
jgi:excisionase family DNA binding protein